MVTTINVPKRTILLPLPLTPAQKQLKLDFLVEKLKSYSLNEIAEQELDLIYFWPLMKNSRLKRLYRNYTLVYSREELKNLLLLSYKDILGPDFVEALPPEENELPVDEIVEEETALSNLVEPLHAWVPTVPLNPADAENFPNEDEAAEAADAAADAQAEASEAAEAAIEAAEAGEANAVSQAEQAEASEADEKEDERMAREDAIPISLQTTMGVIGGTIDFPTYLAGGYNDRVRTLLAARARNRMEKEEAEGQRARDEQEAREAREQMEGEQAEANEAREAADARDRAEDEQAEAREAADEGEDGGDESGVDAGDFGYDWGFDFSLDFGFDFGDMFDSGDASS